MEYDFTAPVWKATYLNPLCKPIIVNAHTEDEAKKLALAQHRFMRNAQADIDGSGMADNMGFSKLFSKVEKVG